MEEEEDRPLVKRPHMPCKLDRRVYIEVEDQLCGVIFVHVLVAGGGYFPPI
jgi:hypothetical protein